MRVKTLVAGLAVSAGALATVGAGSSLAATLYTDSSHTTPVPVGTTAVGKSGAVTLYSGNSVVNKCTSSKLNLRLDQNSGGTVAASITGGSFSGCQLATTVNAPWTPGLMATGSGTKSGSNKIFAASVGNVSVNFAGGTYTGNLTSNITAVQPKSGALQLDLAKSGTLSGPLTSKGKVTATYSLSGAAAAYSLGN